MFGGTAKSYCEYELLCEPFKVDKVYYINVKNPKTGTTRRVRWYMDKAHHELMPRTITFAPFCTLFGFKDTQDTIFCIKKIHITEEEEQEYFGCSRGWRFGMFFGGAWYTKKDTELPPVKNKDKIMEVTWSEFKKEGQEHCKRMGFVSDASKVWFEED